VILGQTFVLRAASQSLWVLYGRDMHKFNIGQTVFLERSLAVPGGARVITKRLPERGGEFEYRVKSANEPHERVVRESQLTTNL
jgi:hypothetical protein